MWATFALFWYSSKEISFLDANVKISFPFFVSIGNLILIITDKFSVAGVEIGTIDIFSAMFGSPFAYEV